MKGLLFTLLLVPVLAQAGRILDSSASVENGIYRVGVVAGINAPADALLRTITDYAHLTAINSSILESSVLQTFSPARHRVRTLMRVCILVFCRDVLQVQDIEQLDATHLVADIVPEHSDFGAGRAEWTLQGLPGRTLLNFHAWVEPSFWVPPVLGAWLFRRKIISEMLETAAHIEMHVMEQSAP